jgi:dihydrofolate reductase
MRRINVSTLVTLDGIMEDPGGFGEIAEGGWSLPFFDEEAERYAHDQLMASDVFLCGRVTYQRFARVWPQIKHGDYAERMNRLPKLVASTTLDEPLEWNASLIKGDVAEEVAKLKQQPGQDILMYGSAGLMRTLMDHDLIDEYRIWVHPVILGSGKHLFSDGGDKTALNLVGVKPLTSGVVILTYQPARTAAA